jgi:hypothetical protein
VTWSTPSSLHKALEANKTLPDLLIIVLIVVLIALQDHLTNVTSQGQDHRIVSKIAFDWRVVSIVSADWCSSG